MQALQRPHGHNFALMGLAFIYPALPTCLVVYVQKSDCHLINVFCVVIVLKKHKLLCLDQVVFSYLYCIATRYCTFGAYDQSYTFALPAIQTAR